jgi:hypothetical protein
VNVARVTQRGLLLRHRSRALGPTPRESRDPQGPGPCALARLAWSGSPECSRELAPRGRNARRSPPRSRRQALQRPSRQAGGVGTASRWTSAGNDGSDQAASRSRRHRAVSYEPISRCSHPVSPSERGQFLVRCVKRPTLARTARVCSGHRSGEGRLEQNPLKSRTSAPSAWQVSSTIGVFPIR